MDPRPLTDDASAEAESKTVESAVPSSAPLPSVIGHTLVMKGELTVGEDLIIEGTFAGTITDQGADTVTVRRSANVSGRISAGTVHVEDVTNLQNTVLSGRISLSKD